MATFRRGLRNNIKALVSLTTTLFVLSVLFYENAFGVELVPNQPAALERAKRYMGSTMGMMNQMCDDARTNLTKDWNYGFDSYLCSTLQKWKPNPNVKASVYTVPGLDPTRDVVYHHCMNVPIFYNETPPLRGPHRPNWPKYGEYLYVPPQRWLHNLEHGAVVFLYHPCADDGEVNTLRHLVTSCLYRHVITPYNRLPEDRPLALLTWGAKLEMNTVDVVAAVSFMRAHAHRAPEDLSKQGQYDEFLLRPARVVSDIDDRFICPWASYDVSIPYVMHHQPTPEAHYWNYTSYAPYSSPKYFGYLNQSFRQR